MADMVAGLPKRTRAIRGSAAPIAPAPGLGRRCEMTRTTTDAKRDALDAAMADVAEILATIAERLAPNDLARARARRRLVQTVASARPRDHHDLPAA